MTHQFEEDRETSEYVHTQNASNFTESHQIVAERDRARIEGRG